MGDRQQETVSSLLHYQTESQANYSDPRTRTCNPQNVRSNPPSIDRTNKPKDPGADKNPGKKWAKEYVQSGKSTQPSGMDVDDYHQDVHNSYPARHGQGDGAMQSHLQLQRSLEASKQMLFGVFGNVLSIVEEFEGREDGRQKTVLPKSRIPISDQTRKSNEDVKSVLETQLILFEKQAGSCPPEVMQSAKDDMKKKTLLWAAVRSEHGRAISDTDVYIGQVYEILSQGKTNHSFYDRPSPQIDARTIQENFPHILSGKHDASMLDKDFKQNREKLAIMPDTRVAKNDDAYRAGAKRIYEVKPMLKNILEADYKRFESEGFSSNK